MNLLKNIGLGIFFLYAMYWGGIGTQSNGAFTQGIGFISIVMALGSLYLLYKFIPKILSTTTTVIIITVVCLYSAYCLGFFNGKSVSEFLTGNDSEVVDNEEDFEDDEVIDDENTDDLAQEMFGNDGDSLQTQDNQSEKKRISKLKTRRASSARPRKQRVQSTKNKGLISRLKETLLGGDDSDNHPSITDINPFDYPSTTGYARVITGSLIQVNGLTIKLFGIAAPDLGQTCANKYGAGYRCGREAAIWLQNWLDNREVTCYILGQVVNNRATGACFVDNNKYDVAAAVTNAGWAVAYTVNTDIYVPYEQQAAQNSRGLWQGEFYKPWDWAKIQNRKVDIQVHAPKPAVSSSDDWGFDMKGLFKGIF